ncbi:disease resistance protein L6-like [Cornus florida]|uniref:disease resistance protein L6-like n=1 Tax=Cornus florida TaxID=4283 RepID=UPI0028A12437|nr:disease resistance protein L6-like [Cornus florida]XP_059644004.1 disease resistance protein L6-like [Cornus florida]
MESMDFEASSSSSLYTPSTSLPLPGGEYDVFLSFRGPDTRLTFTDFLYTYLEDVGVRTFRDDNELRRGEEIGPELLKAITESKISIPIFSRNYASSKWCLRELAQMVECRRTLGQLILPIFYDVEPSDVKHQSGFYEEAFREHERCLDDRTVGKWKEALREVGALKGWEVKKEADGYQGKLIKTIVPTVLLELKKNYMVVTDKMVGIDRHVEELMRSLNIVSNDVRIVGIHGMGGIGKTTIAKYIYNKLLEFFQCGCFLADVRETVQQHKGFVSLQKQLLADTLKWSPDVCDVDSGTNMIKHRFSRKKVLIVLDDVDEKSQFDRLVGKRDWFGSGSRIIVTTRNKHVLNALNVDGSYEPPEMNAEQSLQLFSIHAFRRELPPKEYDSFSRDIASTAAGLPLALEIIGSFLSDKEKVVWEDTLKKLRKIPDDAVQKKLRISYEALNYEQQQIFLDIACLFIGMDKATVFHMWDDCGYYPHKEINVLCLMSLVKMEDDNVLRMHDQVRDLGREIVRQENFKNPEKRSRLWNHEEALEILEERRGTEEVEALSLCFELGSQKPCFTNEDFARLVNLRYLQLDCSDLVVDFSHLLSRLRWLRWRSCPLQFKPTNFHIKNLVILDLSDSGITEDWEGWNQIKVANNLKVLELANCGLRRTPNFSTHATLEILVLRGCQKLVEIDSSIGHLKNLEVLDISNAQVRKLPDEIWMLEKLEVIDASKCHDLEGDIPSNIGRLSSLRFLNFYHTGIQSLPTSIWRLSCLQTLDLGCCEKFQFLPELPSSLKILNVTCTFPNLSGLINLQELQCFECHKVVEIPRDIAKLSKLGTLRLESMNIRSLPGELAALPQLKVLYVQFCANLQSISGFPSTLVELSLDCCGSLERLPDLSNLKSLLELTLAGCDKLTEVQGLGELKLLTSLDISGCDKLSNLDWLEQLTSLTSLEMHEFEYLERTPDLSNLKRLKRLNTFDCQKLIEIQGLDKLESLEELIMSGCKSIVRLPNLSNLKRLAHLELDNCKKSRKIEGLGALESLKMLDVSGCTSLRSIPNLPNTLVWRFKDPDF